MIRKSLLIICIIFILYSGNYLVFFTNASCDLYGDIQSSVDGCLNGTDVFMPSGDLTAESGLKDTIIDWVTNITVALSLFAISGIVVGSYFMVFSSGSEEKIKKGKDVVKWAMLGFLALISSTTIIGLVVNLMYSFE